MKTSNSGSPLIMEDIRPAGLYAESEIDSKDPDYVLLNTGFRINGERIFYKKSEGKVKTYKVSDLKPWKEI